MVKESTAGKPLFERRKFALQLKLPTADTARFGDQLCARAPARSLPSSVTDEYDMGAHVGSGTVAAVRKARRKSDGREFAMKVMFSTDDEERQFMRDEYAMLSSLSSPHIVTVVDLHEGPTCLAIRMELCLRSLDDHVSSRGAFQERSAVPLYRHLLLGVSYLHQKRIVHRDIKPENLLLQSGAASSTYILKIIDFNSAKQIGVGPGSSRMLSERGTSFYSAPELRFGCIWNERVDIWASGMCFYFMGHGQSPLNILEPRQAEIIRSGRLPDISWAGFSDLARNMVQQCLTVEMRDRPSSMELVLHPLFHQGPNSHRARSCENVRFGCVEGRENSERLSVDSVKSPEKTSLSPKLCDESVVAGVSEACSVPKHRAFAPVERQTSGETQWSRETPDETQWIRQTSDGWRELRNHSDGWKELRNHSDALQRLANMRCERAMAEEGQPREHSKPLSDTNAGVGDSLELMGDAVAESAESVVASVPVAGWRTRRKSGKRGQRYLTTHCAYEDAESGAPRLLGREVLHEDV